MKFCRNERGLALGMVLVLSLISLAIVASLIYFVTQGTRSSGFYKRYATAREAGGGGAEISKTLIFNRGNLVIPGIFEKDKDGNTPTTCVCGFDSNPFDLDYPDPSPNTCLCRKLCLPTRKSNGAYNWNLTGCSDSLDPKSDPDFQFNLIGFGTNYQVTAKIIDTTLGVTDLSGEDLGCGSGVAYTCGTFEGPPTPYLYRVEINTQDADQARERSRLSVLYAY